MSENGEDAPSTDSGNGETAIKVLIVDPIDFSRACTVAGLEPGGEFAILACASLADCGPEVHADLILLQGFGSSSDVAGLAAELALASARWPSAATLVVADHPDIHAMLRAVRAGAHGLLGASVSGDCMRSAMRLMVNAVSVYPRVLTDHLRDQARLAATASVAPASAFDPGRLDALTRRQQDVLELLARGYSNKAIAQRLSITESTVKVHLRAIMAQNGATNRTQTVAYFLKRLGAD